MNSRTTSIATFAVFLFNVLAFGAAPQYESEVCFLPCAWSNSVDLSADGTRLYARHNIVESNTAIRIFETATCQFVEELCELDSVPWQFRVSSDGASIWTAFYYGGLATQLSLEDCSVLEQIDVGSWPSDLFFDDARRFLYIGENHPGGDSSINGSLQVIDTWTTEGNSPDASIPLNGQPSKIAKAPRDRFLYVIARNEPNETLYQIDTVDWSIEATLNLGEIGNDVGISVHPFTRQIYVPDLANNQLLVISPSPLEVERVLDFGQDAIRQFFVAPTGDHALVMYENRSYVSVFDLMTDQVTQNIEVGISYSAWNRMVTWSPDAQQAFIALYQPSNSVAVLTVADEADPDSCPGDITGDAIVGFDDFTLLLANWGTCP